MMRIVLGLATITAMMAGCAGTKETGAPASTGPRVDHKPVLFYAKGGSLYVSDPAGTPGRKLTDGPGDFQPAPSPDGRRLAFVRKVPESGPPTPCTNNGGELWVLDLSADSAPASAPRRLVDPAALAALYGPNDPFTCTNLKSPRWSPTGDRIAFLNSSGRGGNLLTAAAATGAVQARSSKLFADDNKYAWAPDGKHIVWVGARYDFSPVDVAVLNVVDGTSQPVATGTNAGSVAYADDGRSVLFTNGDATGPETARPFTLPVGGIYSVEPPAAPRPVLAGTPYGNVAALPGGAIGFTQSGPNPRAEGIQQTMSIQVVDPGGVPRTIADAQGPSPAWVADTVAFIGTAEDRPLLIATDRTPANDSQNNEPQQVDVGVDAFAWSN